MAYFPMCVDLKDKTVLLVGNGRQIGDKAKKLQPFGCQIQFLHTLRPEDLECQPAFVVVGDLAQTEAAQYATLCKERHIPVNVVDQPALCSFTFPALVVEGDLTVAVSTGGKSPAAAACIADRIRRVLPERVGEILCWLSDLRQTLPFAQRRRVAETALSQNRPLTQEELENFK